MRALTGSITLPVTLGSSFSHALRVKVVGGVLALAGADDEEVGTLEQRVLPTDLSAAVTPSNAEGAVYAVAAGPISAFADVYRADGGKISATPNGKRWGVALETAAADGDRIIVMRLPFSGTEPPVVDLTDNATLTAAQLYGGSYTNKGATGAITATLPAAKKGMYGFFRVSAAQEFRLKPSGTDKIGLPSSGVLGAAGKYIVADADGETVALRCFADGEWSPVGYSGNWTAEAS